MTDQALRTTLAYFEAWTGGDFDKAMTYVSPDITCDAPAGRLQGAEAFRAFMGPFAGMLRSAGLRAAYGDDSTALLMYDTETALVAHAPGAERHTVHDGLITHVQIIFDRLPFEEARRGADQAR
ncbi:SnoaL-like protein [Kribbella amoyensis]|uniref:SnoaL-like protein n=1 Tax=Kribbella amoyensis TaxID=996641 RepID=A0A561BRX3_9ACTN|nr:nuclear transport factor 2 family protein [Kribbella amoyensis]TWD81635.1 SnoaL-like protein [Kribbella amoyensis]